MCGIAGFIDLRADQPRAELERTVACMIARLHHRGPDDRGVWGEAETGIALGHSRLSILDLSPHGHQPMLSPCGRFVVVFNGEIYNYREVRRELEERGAAPAWRGHSDTEVMLAAFAAWGVEASLKRFVGMFAFALWDRRERLLFLARDRFGEKPLYLGWQGNVFLFGSELKALRAHPCWQGEIDRGVVASFLRFSYVPSPFSIYRGIRALKPGTLITLACDRARRALGEIPEAVPYWSVREAVEQGGRHPFEGSDAEAVQQLDDLLRASVSRQMIADVPLGAFLSGGVDSSAIVSLMQAQSSRPVRTFTIGFNEAGYDEAVYAKEVARHLGTEHTELYVTSADALEVIPKLPVLYDEPFGDVSQIPTHLVSRMTREHVTVSLSGDGGDELFGGYNRYFWVRSIWDKIGRLPAGGRRLSASLVKSLPPRCWDALFSAAGPVLPARLRQRTPGAKLHKLAEVLSADSPLAIYGQLVAQWKDPAALVIGAEEPQSVLGDHGLHPSGRHYTETMMYLDMVSYLPDDILVKVDRASMGVSLESRTPYLDHNIAEFAWRLPLSLKIRDGQGKWLLRQVLYRYVPPRLIERPKAGFSVPIDSWLRGPLRDWAESLLDEKRMQREGFLRPGEIRRKWREHLSERCDWQYYLWNVLMFQSWLEETRRTGEDAVATPARSMGGRKR